MPDHSWDVAADTEVGSDVGRRSRPPGRDPGWPTPIRNAERYHRASRNTWDENKVLSAGATSRSKRVSNDPVATGRVIDATDRPTLLPPRRDRGRQLGATVWSWCHPPRALGRHSRRAETADRSPCLGRSGPAEREPDRANQDPEGEDPEVGDDASDDDATGRLEQEEHADTDQRPRCSGKEKTARARTPRSFAHRPKWNSGARTSSAATRYRRNALSGIGSPDWVSPISYYPRS